MSALPYSCSRATPVQNLCRICQKIKYKFISLNLISSTWHILDSGWNSDLNSSSGNDGWFPLVSKHFHYFRPPCCPSHCQPWDITSHLRECQKSYRNSCCSSTTDTLKEQGEKITSSALRLSSLKPNKVTFSLALFNIYLHEDSLDQKSRLKVNFIEEANTGTVWFSDVVQLGWRYRLTAGQFSPRTLLCFLSDYKLSFKKWNDFSALLLPRKCHLISYIPFSPSLTHLFTSFPNFSNGMLKLSVTEKVTTKEVLPCKTSINKMSACLPPGTSVRIWSVLNQVQDLSFYLQLP